MAYGGVAMRGEVASILLNDSGVVVKGNSDPNAEGE